MAAPSATARGTPGGIKLKDGYRSTITFARFQTVKFWEKQVQPVGFDGGDAIEQTTMFNDDYMTKAPQSLIDTVDGSATVAYDPAVLSQIAAMINIEDTITYTFKDGSTWAVFGYLKEFTPQGLEIGSQPEAEITIVHTNVDFANDDVEAGPTVTSVAGT